MLCSQDACFICRPKHDEQGDSKAQMKLQLVSLDGLLDYQLEDDDFEVTPYAHIHTTRETQPQSQECLSVSVIFRSMP
jgi:hypothetical protein